MPHITQDDYEKLTGNEPPNNFKELEIRASDTLDVLTRFYFVRNELDESFKATQFKKAVAYQVEYYVVQEVTTMEEVNNMPDSVRVGDTTVSYSRMNATAKTSRTSPVSDDAINVLRGTGLLYRGAYHV